MNNNPISPKLIGDKVMLGPFREDLNDTYRRWLHNLDNGFGLHPSLFLTHEHEIEWIRSMVKPNAPFFTIYEKTTEAPIGTISLINQDNINRNAELGIFIGEEDFKSKGYGTESIQLVLDYGFNILNLECIYLRVHAFNERAAGLYKKVGFKHAGVRRRACYVAGKYYDDILMDIVKEEFTGSCIKNGLQDFINTGNK